MSSLPFDSDVESVPPPEPAKKRGRKPAVKRQAPQQKKKSQPVQELSSESESEGEEESTQPSKRGRKPANKKQPSTPGKKKKQPVPVELSSDSETEDEEVTTKRKKCAILDESEDEKSRPIVAQKLQNLLWRKVPSGYTSQRDFSRKGELYIDFRISYAHDAESKDGYKKTLISYKSHIDKSSAVYKAAEKLIIAAKADYKNITPVLYPKND